MPEKALEDRDHSITVSEADCFTMTGLVLFGARESTPCAHPWRLAQLAQAAHCSSPQFSHAPCPCP
jgi:AraC-like DNA-binding protein